MSEESESEVLNLSSIADLARYGIPPLDLEHWIDLEIESENPDYDRDINELMDELFPNRDLDDY